MLCLPLPAAVVVCTAYTYRLARPFDTPTTYDRLSSADHVTAVREAETTAYRMAVLNENSMHKSIIFMVHHRWRWCCSGYMASGQGRGGNELLQQLCCREERNKKHKWPDPRSVRVAHKFRMAIKIQYLDSKPEANRVIKKLSCVMVRGWWSTIQCNQPILQIIPRDSFTTLNYSNYRKSHCNVTYYRDLLFIP